VNSPEVKDIPSSNDDPTVGATHKIKYSDGSDLFSYYYFLRTTDVGRSCVLRMTS
jgi:hypothetical protein